MGFVVPLAEWFRTSLKPVFEAAVLGRNSEPLVDRGEVRRLWAEHQSSALQPRAEVVESADAGDVAGRPPCGGGKRGRGGAFGLDAAMRAFLLLAIVVSLAMVAMFRPKIGVYSLVWFSLMRPDVWAWSTDEVPLRANSRSWHADRQP